MLGNTQYNAPTTDTPFDSIELVDLLPFVDADVEDFDTSKTLIGGYTRETWRSLSILIMRQERRKKAGKKMVRNFSGCLALPLDLIFEIFGYLHPLDIYHISQTARSLRNVVLARSAQSLWRQAYKRHRDVPRCPPSMSEPAWTALIFSAMLCEECGQCRVLTDFALRMSLCDTCMDSCYVLRNPPANAKPTPYPKDHVVWELLPHSCRCRVKRDSPWVTSAGAWYYKKIWYLASDVHAMAETVARFEDDIVRGRPGAREAFEKFKMDTKKKVHVWVKHVDKLIAWANKCYDEIGVERHKCLSGYAHIIAKRFLLSGYDKEDFTPDMAMIALYQHDVEKLTGRVWSNIRPLIEKEIIERRDARIRRPRDALHKKRKDIIEDAYIEYKKTLQPSTWKFLPHIIELFTHDTFSSLINLPDSSDLAISTCRDAMEQLPGYLTERRERQRRELCAMLPNTGDTLDRLGLATSVVICIRCAESRGYGGSCEFGWEEVRAHNWCAWEDDSPGRWMHSAVGSRVAATLARLLGLDLRTATVSEMGQLDARFLCAKCPVAHYRRLNGRKVFTWRECVIHAMEMESDEDHDTHSWHLLTPETTAVIKLHETKYPSTTDKAWSCNHCAIHVRDFVTRKAALHHVRSVHSVGLVRDNIDLLYQRGSIRWYTPRRPVCLSLDPPAEYRCGRCPELGFSLFIRERLVQHLIDKHGIDDSIEEDLVKIIHIRRTSTPEQTL